MQNKDMYFRSINRQDILPTQYTGVDKAKMEKIIMKEMDLPNNPTFYGLTTKSKLNTVGSKGKSITPMNVSTAHLSNYSSET